MTELEQKIQEVYDASVILYFAIADDQMKRCGHCGVSGPATNEPWNPSMGVLEGAIGNIKAAIAKTKKQKLSPKEWFENIFVNQDGEKMPILWGTNTFSDISAVDLIERYSEYLKQ